MQKAIVLLVLMLSSDALGYADHWISKGKYLSPDTQQSCCNESDCKIISERQVVKMGDGWMTYDPPYLFKKVFKSEDEHTWRCVNRCLFLPGGT